MVAAVIFGLVLSFGFCWCLNHCDKYCTRRLQLQRERQRQLLQARSRRQNNIALVRGRQQRHPLVRLQYTPEQNDEHELEERQPVVESWSASASEPLIHKEEASHVFMPQGARGPTNPDSEP